MKKKSLYFILFFSFISILLPLNSLAAGNKKYLVLGDDVASRSGLSTDSKAFYEIYAESKSYDIINGVENGLTSVGLLNKVSKDTYNDTLKSADFITISIGLYDYLNVAYEMAAKEYNDDNSTTITASELEESIQNGEMTYRDVLMEVYEYIEDNTLDVYEELLEELKQNITDIIEEIRKDNLHATIVVLDIYNPYPTYNFGWIADHYLPSYSAFFMLTQYHQNNVINFVSNDGHGFIFLDYGLELGDKSNFVSGLVNINMIEDAIFDIHLSSAGHLKVASLLSDLFKEENKPKLSIEYSGNKITEYDFYKEEEGYSASASGFVIKNEGVLSSMVTASSANYFDVTFDKNIVGSNELIIVDIKPKVNLPIGVYNERITFNGTDALPFYLDLTFEVTKKKYAVSFDANGGSYIGNDAYISLGDIELDYGEYGFPKARKDLEAFTGYYTEATNGELIIDMNGNLLPNTVYTDADGKWIKDDDVTLYAHYMEYEILVNDTVVIATNASDILGDGKVSYDMVTKTLTINNRNIDVLVINQEELNIEVIGNVTFTEIGGTINNRNLTFKGNGNVTFNEFFVYDLLENLIIGSGVTVNTCFLIDVANLVIEGNLNINGSNHLGDAGITAGNIKITHTGKLVIDNSYIGIMLVPYLNNSFEDLLVIEDGGVLILQNIEMVGILAGVSDSTSVNRIFNIPDGYLKKDLDIKVFNVEDEGMNVYSIGPKNVDVSIDIDKMQINGFSKDLELPYDEVLPNTPQTVDNINISFIVGVVSIVVIIGMVVYLKKKNFQNN